MWFNNLIRKKEEFKYGICVTSCDCEHRNENNLVNYRVPKGCLVKLYKYNENNVELSIIDDTSNSNRLITSYNIYFDLINAKLFKYLNAISDITERYVFYSNREWCKFLLHLEKNTVVNVVSPSEPEAVHMKAVFRETTEKNGKVFITVKLLEEPPEFLLDLLNGSATKKKMHYLFPANVIYKFISTESKNKIEENSLNGTQLWYCKLCHTENLNHTRSCRQCTYTDDIRDIVGNNESKVGGKSLANSSTEFVNNNNDTDTVEFTTGLTHNNALNIQTEKIDYSSNRTAFSFNGESLINGLTNKLNMIQPICPSIFPSLESYSLNLDKCSKSIPEGILINTDLNENNALNIPTEKNDHTSKRTAFCFNEKTLNDGLTTNQLNTTQLIDHISFPSPKSYSPNLDKCSKSISEGNLINTDLNENNALNIQMKKNDHTSKRTSFGFNEKTLNDGLTTNQLNTTQLIDHISFPSPKSYSPNLDKCSKSISEGNLKDIDSDNQIIKSSTKTIVEPSISCAIDNQTVTNYRPYHTIDPQLQNLRNGLSELRDLLDKDTNGMYKYARYNQYKVNVIDQGLQSRHFNIQENGTVESETRDVPQPSNLSPYNLYAPSYETSTIKGKKKNKNKKKRRRYKNSAVEENLLALPLQLNKQYEPNHELQHSPQNINNTKTVISCYICHKIALDAINLKCQHVFCLRCLVSSFTSLEDAECPVKIGRYLKCTYKLGVDDIQLIFETISNGLMIPTEIVYNNLPPFVEQSNECLIVCDVDSNEVVFHCRTPNCKGLWFVDKTEGHNTYACPLCEAYNCVKCQAIHNGKKCDIPKTLISFRNIPTLT